MRSLLLAVVFMLNMATAATPLISLDIPHPLTSAPGNFRARLTIEPQASNRMACLYVQPLSTGESTSSCWTLNGEQEPRTYWHNITRLSAGHYEVTAAVLDSADHRTLSVSVRLTVIGPGMDPEPSNP